MKVECWNVGYITYDYYKNTKENKIIKESLKHYSLLDIIRVLPKGRTFTANSGTKAAVMPKGRSSTANSGAKVAVCVG